CNSRWTALLLFPMPSRSITWCNVTNLTPMNPGREADRRRGLALGPNERNEREMTHTVCQPCYDCKYTDCCVVCPVECFYQDDMLLYIDPVDCIDCEACVPECPVEAIFAEANVPAQWTNWTQINAERSAAPKESG